MAIRDAFRIIAEAPTLEPLLAAVASPAHGAVVAFLGVVRENSGDTRVAGLDYSAYEEMALGKMADIADEMRERFGPLAVAATHRVGRLAVGEISLALAVGAPHRKEAFAASAYFVDRLKQIVPIWKQDIEA